MTFHSGCDNNAVEDRRFPIQGGLTVSWEAAERAYEHYAGKYGRSQSLERLAERGGFGVLEYVWLYGGARGNECGDVISGLHIRDETLSRALREGDVKVR